MPDNQDERSVARGYGTGYSIIGAGFQFAFSILFFMWIGSLVDRGLHTKPLFLLLGLGLGFVAGGYAAWSRVMAASKGRDS
jgi:F0F1-type ATP synthase assembly protein I